MTSIAPCPASRECHLGRRARERIFGCYGVSLSPVNSVSKLWPIQAGAKLNLKQATRHDVQTPCLAFRGQRRWDGCHATPRDPYGGVYSARLSPTPWGETNAWKMKAESIRCIAVQGTLQGARFERHGSTQSPSCLGASIQRSMGPSGTG